MLDLSSPIRVAGLTFRNRLVMPPMVRMSPLMPPDVVGVDGSVTPEVVEHYRLRAAAGTGLIIVEATCVDPTGRAWNNGLNLTDDGHTEGMARIAEAISAEGCVPGIQLVHGGPQCDPAACGGVTYGPSRVAPSKAAPRPRAVTREEIGAITDRFTAAAARAVAAGYRLLDVHGAHGYLLDSFLSPVRNTREDEYGGTPENRRRFMCDVVRRMASAAGDAALTACRISLFNKLADGFTVADLLALAAALVDAGAQVIDLSTDGALKPLPGSDQTLGQALRAHVPAPVILAGELQDPQNVQAALAGGHADFVAVGRGMLWDAAWASTALASATPSPD
ncbi:MAG: NADH:flavin oxidoreductase [Armatimonadetes bacterium]|nr:NADH:flavin oxidoreductase [Armatimonadota bacterium]